MGKLLQLAVVILVAWLIVSNLPDLGGDNKPDPVDPRPDPDDDKEPDFSGYDDKVYDRIMLVKSRNRQDECKQLSRDVGEIIEQIDDDEITTNKGVVDALVVAFKKLPRAWYGQVRSIADDVLQPLTEDGSLSTPQRWAKLLRVARKGIDRAAKESTGVEDEDAD